MLYAAKVANTMYQINLDILARPKPSFQIRRRTMTDLIPVITMVNRNVNIS